MFLRIRNQIISSCFVFVQIVFRRPFLYDCLVLSTENVLSVYGTAVDEDIGPNLFNDTA